MKEKTCQGCIHLDTNDRRPYCNKAKLLLGSKDLIVPYWCENGGEDETF